MSKDFDQMNHSEKANYVLALLEREKQRREGAPAPLLVFPQLEKVVNASEIRTLKGRDGREFIPPTCQVFDLEKQS